MCFSTLFHNVVLIRCWEILLFLVISMQNYTYDIQALVCPQSVIEEACLDCQTCDSIHLLCLHSFPTVAIPYPMHTLSKNYNHQNKTRNSICVLCNPLKLDKLPTHFTKTTCKTPLDPHMWGHGLIIIICNIAMVGKQCTKIPPPQYTSTAP